MRDKQINRRTTRGWPAWPNWTPEPSAKYPPT